MRIRPRRVTLVLNILIEPHDIPSPLFSPSLPFPENKKLGRPLFEPPFPPPPPPPRVLQDFPMVVHCAVFYNTYHAWLTHRLRRRPWRVSSEMTRDSRAGNVYAPYDSSLLKCNFSSVRQVEVAPLNKRHSYFVALLHDTKNFIRSANIRMTFRTCVLLIFLINCTLLQLNLSLYWTVRGLAEQSAKVILKNNWMIIYDKGKRGSRKKTAQI